MQVVVSDREAAMWISIGATGRAQSNAGEGRALGTFNGLGELPHAASVCDQAMPAIGSGQVGTESGLRAGRAPRERERRPDQPATGLCPAEGCASDK